jgi:acyl-coenzyme A thioesterase PaaI-like protein
VTSTVVLEPDNGCVPVDPFSRLGATYSFVSGDAQTDRLQIRYFRRACDDALIGKVWFGPRAEGPPGHAHGGSMAAVLDEAMGAAAWMQQRPVLASALHIEFLSMLPLERVVTVEAMLQNGEGRRIRITSCLRDDQRVFARGSGVFVEVSAERFRPYR